MLAIRFALQRFEFRHTNCVPYAKDDTVDISRQFDRKETIDKSAETTAAIATATAEL